MIALLSSNSNPAWKMGVFQLEMHVSLFDHEPMAFISALGTGQVECCFVGKGLYNSYFLLTVPCGTSRVRIGTAEAIFFHDIDYHRFADEVHSDASK